MYIYVHIYILLLKRWWQFLIIVLRDIIIRQLNVLQNSSALNIDVTCNDFHCRRLIRMLRTELIRIKNYSVR